MCQFLKSGATFVLSIGLAACYQAPAPKPVVATPVDNTSFRNCVDREAKAAFQSVIGRAKDESALALTFYGYPIAVENEIISTCNPRLNREGLQDNIYTTNPDYLYINAAAKMQQKAASQEKVDKDIAAQRKQAELDAPRLKVEKEERDAAGVTYYLCLVRHAKILSLNSNEPAEIIVQATVPSCSEGRQAVIDAYRRHNKILNTEDMDIIEGRFKQSLLLEVIKARAPRPAPSAPAATKPESSI